MLREKRRRSKCLQFDKRTAFIIKLIIYITCNRLRVRILELCFKCIYKTMTEDVTSF